MERNNRKNIFASVALTIELAVFSFYQMIVIKYFWSFIFRLVNKLLYNFLLFFCSNFVFVFIFSLQFLIMNEKL